MCALKLRSGQVISPFGVGSLFEIDGQSFFVRGVQHWKPEKFFDEVKIEALERRLPHNKSLRRATKFIPATRFPEWLFCPSQSCGNMQRYGYSQEILSADKKTPERPRCRKCNRHMTPMRFVRVCEKGHLEDIDWYAVAHKDKQQSSTGPCSRAEAKLAFRSAGAFGGDFASMSISCSCGESGDLRSISEGPVSRCSGRQPGEHGQNANVSCGEQMFMLPRGAGALHYAHVASALDIATSTNVGKAQALLDDAGFRHFAKYARKSLKAGQPIDHITEGDEDIILYAQEHAMTPAEVMAVFRKAVSTDESGEERTGGDLDQLDILSDEFAKLVDPVGIRAKNFYTTPLRPTRGLEPFFEKLVQVKRLREVRAFYGFTRRKGDPSNLVAPDLGSNASGWLPATEVIGEGIFLHFSSAAIGRWLDANTTAIEGSIKEQAIAAENDDLPSRFGFNANAAFIMAHTFSHALVKQLAFTCGYSSSSLRERVYCKPIDDIGVGVLVYTADSDSEGSMGGLVEMGEPSRLEPVIRQALENLRWCSNDPVCREHSDHVSYSRAACHACSFIAETSCAFQNYLLNRLLVIGTGRTVEGEKQEPLGYFSSMVGD